MVSLPEYVTKDFLKKVEVNVQVSDGLFIQNEGFPDIINFSKLADKMCLAERDLKPLEFNDCILP